MKTYCNIAKMGGQHKSAKAAYTKAMGHNLRTSQIDRIDISKSHKNEILMGVGAGKDFMQFREEIQRGESEEPTFWEVQEERVKSSPYYQNRKPRKDAVRGLSIVLSMGEADPHFAENGEVVRDYPEKFDLDKWKTRCCEWMKEKYGEENIVSAVLHMEETHPHIHFVVVPMTERGSLDAAKIVGYKKGLSEFQHEYNDWMVKEFGFEKIVAAGKGRSNDIYRNLAEYDRARVQAGKSELPYPDPDEEIEAYAERVMEADRTRKYQDLAEKDKLRRKIKEMENSIVAQNEEIAHVRAENEMYHDLITEDIDELKFKSDAMDILKYGFETFSDDQYSTIIRNGMRDIYKEAIERSGRYEHMNSLDYMWDDERDQYLSRD